MADNKPVLVGSECSFLMAHKYKKRPFSAIRSKKESGELREI